MTSCAEVNTPLTTHMELTLKDAIADDRNGNGTLKDRDPAITLTVTNPSPAVACKLIVTTKLDTNLRLIIDVLVPIPKLTPSPWDRPW